MDTRRPQAPHAGRRLGAQGANSPACAPAAPRPACSSRSTSMPTARRCRSTRSASVSVPEPRMLSVQVWDQSTGRRRRPGHPRGQSRPQPDRRGQLLRIPIPELNAERRQELVKVAHKYAEQARVAVRHVRRDGLDHLKKEEKDGGMSEDDEQQARRPDPEDDRRDDRRDRPDARRQGSRDHAGLRSERPDAAMTVLADQQRGRRARRRRPACRAMSRSSWTATAAGRPARGLPRSEGHRRGVEAVRRDGAGGDRARHRASDAVQLLLGELVAAAGRGRVPLRPLPPVHPPRPRRLHRARRAHQRHRRARGSAGRHPRPDRGSRER